MARSETRTIFITGATGFVGSHTARKFMAEGWRVRALVRRPDRPGLLPEGVMPVAGDLREPRRYQEAMRGCDVVLHVAGLVKARTLADYRSVNVAGARAVAVAAANACPEARLVLVSSQAAAGPTRDGRPVTETDPPRPISWYGRSKLEGEQAVISAFPGAWSIVRPSVVYGAGDPGLLQAFRLAQKGWLPLPAGGEMPVQLISVEDLAEVLYAAATAPEAVARRGFAAHETVKVREIAAEVASLCAPPARLIPIPAAAVRAVALVESARQGLTGAVLPFNRDKAREMLADGWECDARPFLSDLRVTLRNGWKEGIARACRCYVKAGWLRQNVWTV